MVMKINDPCYPQIAKAMDKGLMCQLLQDAVFSSTSNNTNTSTIVESCEIKNKRHKPGKSFVLSYHLVLLDMQTGIQREQVIGARLCKIGQGQQELDEEREKHQRNTCTQSTVIYLPELEMLVWVFPHDRKLIHLAQILNLDFLRARFHTMLSLLNCSAGSVKDVKTEVLHYLPERSCMVRYRLTVYSQVNDAEVNKIIYGKNYRDDRGSEVYSIMQQLVVQLPKCAIPLGYDAEYRTLWQSHLPGIPLAWSDLETTKASGLLKNMASCLTAFQDCQINTPNQYGFPEIDEQLFDTIKAAEPQDKHLSKQISLWVTKLLDQRQELSWPNKRIQPLHQDLHLGNFMVDENNICLIDLDSVCLGDPLADIGSLVSNFYRNGLHAGRDISYVDKIVEQFLQVYAEISTQKFERSQLNWYIAAAFVHEVIRRVLRQRHAIGLKHIQTYLVLSKRFVDFTLEELENA
jgi:Phosphotransferase enzyme family